MRNWLRPKCEYLQTITECEWTSCLTSKLRTKINMRNQVNNIIDPQMRTHVLISYANHITICEHSIQLIKCELLLKTNANSISRPYTHRLFAFQFFNHAKPIDYLQTIKASIIRYLISIFQSWLSLEPKSKIDFKPKHQTFESWSKNHRL